jgi:hypothetical protein
MVQEGGRGTGGRWGGMDGAGGRPVKLDSGRCPTAGEEWLR